MGESYRKQNLLFLYFTLLEYNLKNWFVNLIQTLKINKNIIVKLCTSILIEIFNKKTKLKTQSLLLVYSAINNYLQFINYKITIFCQELRKNKFYYLEVRARKIIEIGKYG